MKIISQDGRKAIDSAEISYFFIVKNNGWNLLVMPKGQTGDCEWSSLIFFQHNNEEIVTTMLQYLQRLMTPDSNSVIKVDIPTFYSYGMEEFAPELLKTDFEKSGECPEKPL